MEKDEYDLFLYIRKYALGTICVVIVISNLFSLFVLYRIHDMHDVTKLLMMALTTTDIAVGLFGFTDALLSHYQVYTYNIVANLGSLFQIFGLNILAMITIVRYIAVSRPLRLETFVTKRRSYISLIIAFLISLTLMTSFCIVSRQFLYDIHLKIVITVTYVYPLIPILIVFILYIKLLFIARHQARRIASAEINAANAQAQLRRSNFKSLNTFMIITGTTIVTWLPTCGNLYFHMNNQTISSWQIFILIEILRYSNSWLNTLIYCWRNEGFRKVAKRLICRNPRVIPDVSV